MVGVQPFGSGRNISILGCVSSELDFKRLPPFKSNHGMNDPSIPSVSKNLNTHAECTELTVRHKLPIQ